MEGQSRGARTFKTFHNSAFVWDMSDLVILFSNPNTSTFVSLNNSSTLTISDLFLAHSSVHAIDLKHGL